ncbi:hypothetical protein WJX75_005615 [Coccomyxa subellipsoidea]|uniref:Uncharacterized protein n=1 Tax=Coccomyxa subellipsoidea TaxID=248742 RepID=A0ABR2Z380_9CHLO
MVKSVAAGGAQPSGPLTDALGNFLDQDVSATDKVLPVVRTAGAGRQLQPLSLPGGPLLGGQASRGPERALPDRAGLQGQPLLAVAGPRYGSGSFPQPPTLAAFDSARAPAIHSDSLRSESLRTWGGKAPLSVNATAMQERWTKSASGRLHELGHTVI